MQTAPSTSMWILLVGLQSSAPVYIPRPGGHVTHPQPRLSCPTRQSSAIAVAVKGGAKQPLPTSKESKTNFPAQQKQC